MPRCLSILAIALALVLSIPGAAEDRDVSAGAAIEGTREAILASSFFDQSYKIQVAMPLSYAATEQKYPVVYLLDSDIMFGLLADVSRLLPLEGIPMFLGRQRVPELIVVGIGYPGGVAEMTNKRGRDMNPPEGEKGEVNSDGAASFYRFLAKDLISWVESNYRAESSDRTLLGVSRGGVFTLSTLLLHPETFQRYIAISPVVEPPIYDYLEVYSKRKEKPPARLFISAGSAGDIESGIAQELSRLIERLEDLGDNLDWSSESYEGESHASVVPRAFVDGLVAVFSEPEAAGGTP